MLSHPQHNGISAPRLHRLCLFSALGDSLKFLWLPVLQPATDLLLVQLPWLKAEVIDETPKVSQVTPTPGSTNNVTTVPESTEKQAVNTFSL